MSSFNAEEAENLEDIEKQFAVKAVEQAQVYWSLLEKVNVANLKLTSLDDEIMEKLVECFPEFENPEAAKTLNEPQMKSKEGKERWRLFCNYFEKKVPDYNFGTLLRISSSGEYSEENTMFAYRVQFYAVEIARNRYGLNDWVRK